VCAPPSSPPLSSLQQQLAQKQGAIVVPDLAQEEEWWTTMSLTPPEPWLRFFTAAELQKRTEHILLHILMIFSFDTNHQCIRYTKNAIFYPKTCPSFRQVAGFSGTDAEQNWSTIGSRQRQSCLFFKYLVTMYIEMRQKKSISTEIELPIIRFGLHRVDTKEDLEKI